ncbi:MAG: NADH-quinone oxidoreductase subunit I [Ignavibacteria bacterium]|jgi:NADH-quinone oxidoreductase subunit I|nr:NADH-quinone oxidoreductase subunit I [Ignavibacteria bacterium]
MNDISKRQIARNNLTTLEKLYLPEIARGMGLVLKRMFQFPKPTRQYPEERWEPTGSYRGRPVLVQENGKERCVACGLCARVCPALAITVQASDTTDAKERYPVSFEINMLRCIFCGFCEEVCPEEAIVMSKDYELVFQSHEGAVMDKARLLQGTDTLHDRLEFVRRWK